MVVPAAVRRIETQIRRPVTFGDLSTPILESARQGRQLEPQAVANARRAFSEAAQAATSWTDRFDAVPLPILDVVPWPNGTPGPTSHLGGVVCGLANFSGQPSTVIPTVHRGLPVGVQLQAPVGHDGLLIDLLNPIRPIAPSPVN